MDTMRIGAIAERSGVSVRAMRYYEEHGLLTSHRSATGQRLYDSGAVGRIAMIQQLYAAGISSAGIRSLLPSIEQGEASPEIIAGLRKQRAELQSRIRDLQATVTRLDDVIDSAENPRDDCEIVTP